MKIFNLLKNIAQEMRTRQLTTTYISNSYVTQTSFNRIAFFKTGKVVVCRFNLGVDNLGTTGGNFVRIGTVDFGKDKPISDTYLTIPSQNGNGVLLFQVLATGAIEIYNGTSTPINSFCRTVFPIPLA